MALQLVYRAARSSLTASTAPTSLFSGITFITQSTRALSLSSSLQGPDPSPWGGRGRASGGKKLSFAERKKAREELAAQRPTYKIHKGKKDITEYPDEVKPQSRQSRFYDPADPHGKRSLVYKLKTGQLSQELKMIQEKNGSLPDSLSAFMTSKGERPKESPYSRRERARGSRRSPGAPQDPDDIAAMIRGDKEFSSSGSGKPQDKNFRGSRDRGSGRSWEKDSKSPRDRKFGERGSRAPRTWESGRERDGGFGGAKDRAARPLRDRDFGNGQDRDSRPPRDGAFGGARDRNSRPPTRDHDFGGARDRDSGPPRDNAFGGSRESRPPRESNFGGARDFRPPRDGAFSGGRDRDSRQPRHITFGESREPRPPRESNFRGARDFRPPRDGAFNSSRDRDSRQPRDIAFGGSSDSRPPRESSFGSSREPRPPRDGTFGGARDTDSRQPRDKGFGGPRDFRPPRENSFGAPRESRPPRDGTTFGGARDRDSRPSRNSSFGSPRDSYSKKPEDFSSDRPLPARRNDPISIPYTTAASQFLYGKSVVEAALNSGRRKLYKLYIHNGANRENVEDNKLIRSLAARRGVEVVTLRSEDDVRLLDKMANSRPHNGFVLEVSPLPQPPLRSLGPVPEAQEEYAAKPGFPIELGHQSAEEKAVNGADTFIPSKSVTHRPLVVVLDRVLDPGNLGAILRTADFLGVTAVGVTKFGGAKLTPVALKASSGAAESMSIFEIVSLPEFLNSSRANGWVTYAAVAKEPGVHRLRRHVDLYDVERADPLRTAPCILILGSEGEGLDRLVVKKADYELSVPNMSGSGSVDSLNVGIAAGLLCTSFLKGMTRELNGLFGDKVQVQEEVVVVREERGERLKEDLW